jgi:hypothetical protein
MSNHDDDGLTVEATAPDEAQETDTEGHWLQMNDLARTMHNDRLRNATEVAKQSRMRDQPKKGGRGFLKRGG